MVLILLAGLTFIHGTRNKPYQKFLEDLAQVEVGMPQKEVEQLMAAYTVGSGWPSLGSTELMTVDQTGVRTVGRLEPETDELTIAGAVIYRYTDNSDWGVVHYDENGKVRGVEFLPD